MKNTSNTETRKGNLYLSNYSLLIFSFRNTNLYFIIFHF